MKSVTFKSKLQSNVLMLVVIMVSTLAACSDMRNLKPYTTVFVFLLSLILSISSCSKDQSEEPKPDHDGGSVTVENVSYSNFAGALFENRCSGCHRPGGSASSRWTFSGLASVRDHAARINQVVLVNQSMPPTGALSARERELLDAWLNKRNMPEN